MLDYTRDAERLIKNVRWWRVRLRVRRALEKAYRDGLHDALDKVLELPKRERSFNAGTSSGLNHP
jgi:hypothetical protein